MSRPARTARSASSSCATGAPKKAMIASPNNLATVPSCLLTEALRKANAPFMISATCSGSSRSPSPVESTTSAKSTVTYLRSPSTLTWASSWAPQLKQNLAPSGLAVWQLGQFISTPHSVRGSYLCPNHNYLTTACATQSVCGLAPIKVKRAIASTALVSPVVASVMVISSNLVSLVTSTTVDRVSTMIG